MDRQTEKKRVVCFWRALLLLTMVKSKFIIRAPMRFMISPASQMYRKTSESDSPD